MKTLVVYYSRKGYTQQIALETAKRMEADFLCLETIENTAGYAGFRNCLKFGLAKKGMTLFPYETNVGEYDKVILCSPIWCGEISAPMKTFLERERHHIADADYILTHYLPIRADKAADAMDSLLRLKRGKLTDVQCIWGHFLKETETTND